jgi:DnaJ-class molecular chaperone
VADFYGYWMECPHCSGTGEDTVDLCVLCDGSGQVWHEYEDDDDE